MSKLKPTQLNENLHSSRAEKKRPGSGVKHDTHSHRLTKMSIFTSTAWLGL
jgi:hypothetical protein